MLPAIVTDVDDPDRMGRVQVKLSSTFDSDHRVWAQIVTLFSNNEPDKDFLLNVDDAVLVSFEYGDIRRPFVFGILHSWSKMRTENIKNVRRTVRCF